MPLLRSSSPFLGELGESSRSTSPFPLPWSGRRGGAVRSSAAGPLVRWLASGREGPWTRRAILDSSRMPLAPLLRPRFPPLATDTAHRSRAAPKKLVFLVRFRVY